MAWSGSGGTGPVVQESREKASKLVIENDRKRRQSAEETCTRRASKDHDVLHCIMNAKWESVHGTTKMCLLRKGKGSKGNNKEASVLYKAVPWLIKRKHFYIICALACCLCVTGVLLYYNIAVFLSTLSHKMLFWFFKFLSAKWTQTRHTVKGTDTIWCATINLFSNSSKHWFFLGIRCH